MGHPLGYESGGAGSRSQYKTNGVLCTEIRNQRHRIRSGEGAPFGAKGRTLFHGTRDQGEHGRPRPRHQIDDLPRPPLGLPATSDRYKNSI